MLTVLTRLLDQQRATELVDFVLIFVLLLALAMLILFLVVYSRNRRLRREMRESSSELYYFLLPTLALDGKDHQLIKRLAQFLPFPQQKHRIMVNPRIFDFCARRLLAAKQAEQGAVANLRSKLGFPKNAEVLMPVSSLDLPPDIAVLLIQKGKPALRGRLVSSDEDSLAIEVEGEPSAAPEQGPLNVYFQNRAGFFSFSTRITAREERILRLDHSDKIKRFQRRRYTRKQLRLPVYVQPYQGASAPFKSLLVDLSGGGASLQNPQCSFGLDQQVELSFAPHGEKFHILGQVVRVSKGGRMLHVEFQALEEAERKRIFRSVF
jgi:c-di-GMP-binding flagellar brake protein YcgR